MMVNCVLCVSNEDITYDSNGYIFCKKCYNNISKYKNKKCDICGLYCNDKCLDIFTNSLRI